MKNEIPSGFLKLEDGKIKVSGALSFATVSDLRRAGESLLIKEDVLEFNLEQVSRSDSSGLALLVAWLRFANKNNKKIIFTHLPKQLADIAKVGRLDGILPI